MNARTFPKMSALVIFIIGLGSLCIKSANATAIMHLCTQGLCNSYAYDSGSTYTLGQFMNPDDPSTLNSYFEIDDVRFRFTNLNGQDAPDQIRLQLIDPSGSDAFGFKLSALEVSTNPWLSRSVANENSKASEIDLIISSIGIKFDYATYEVDFIQRPTIGGQAPIVGEAQVDFYAYPADYLKTLTCHSPNCDLHTYQYVNYSPDDLPLPTNFSLLINSLLVLNPSDPTAYLGQSSVTVKYFKLQEPSTILLITPLLLLIRRFTRPRFEGRNAVKRNRAQ